MSAIKLDARERSIIDKALKRLLSQAGYRESALAGFSLGDQIDLYSQIPSQVTEEDSILSSDGENLTWITKEDIFPAQTGNSGKVLSTNGTNVSWVSTGDALPDQTGNDGKVLGTDGVDASWVDAPTSIPDQTGSSGKFLSTDGSDLLWDTPAGGSSDLNFIEDIAALRLFEPETSTAQVYLEGYYAEGDGGGGHFYWDSTSTIADNGGTVIKPTSVSVISQGRWLRPKGSHLNVLWFGAKGDWNTTGTDNLDAFNRCLQASRLLWTNSQLENVVGYTQGPTIYVPTGVYYFSDTFHINRTITLAGESRAGGSFGPTAFIFPANTTGIKLASSTISYTINSITRASNVVTINIGDNITSAERTDNVTTLTISAAAGAAYSAWYFAGNEIDVFSTSGNFTGGVKTITATGDSISPSTISYPDPGPDVGPTANIGRVTYVFDTSTGLTTGREGFISPPNGNFESGGKILTSATNHVIQYNEAGSNTSASGGTVNRGSGGSVVINDISIVGSGNDTETHGIYIGAGIVTCNRVLIRGFGGDGFHIQGSTPETNSNLWRLESCRAFFCRNGLYVFGGDSSAGGAMFCDFSFNDRYGIWDNSFLGNSYVANHTSGNNVNRNAGIGDVNIIALETAGTETKLYLDVPTGRGTDYYVDRGVGQANELNVFSLTPKITNAWGGGIVRPMYNSRNSYFVLTPGSMTRTGGNTVTVTTVVTNDLVPGDTFTISPGEDDFAAGTKTVVSASSHTIVYTEAGDDTINGSTQELSCQGWVSYLEDQYFITSAVRSSNVATLTLDPVHGGTHGLQVGSLLVVSIQDGDSSFGSGQKTLTAVTTSTVSYVDAGADVTETNIGKAYLGTTAYTTDTGSSTVNLGGGGCKANGSVNESIFLGNYSEGDNGEAYTGLAPAIIMGGAGSNSKLPTSAFGMQYSSTGAFIHRVDAISSPSMGGGPQTYGAYSMAHGTQRLSVRRTGTTGIAGIFDALSGRDDTGPLVEYFAFDDGDSGGMGRGWVSMHDYMEDEVSYGYSTRLASQGSGQFSVPNGIIVGVPSSTSQVKISPSDYTSPAAPSTGTHRVGEYVINSKPTVGTPIGWVCKTAGTPGTWEALPSLGTGVETSTANTYTKSQNVAAVALTDAATISTDASLSNVFTVTLGGDRTLENPTNLVAGGTYLWIITQDGSGGRSLSYDTYFKWPGGVAPTLTASIGAIDMISAVWNGTILICTASLDFS